MSTGRMFDMVAAQLVAAAEREAQEQARQRQALQALQANHFNPRPPGQIHAGSATEQVLRFFRERPGRWWSRYQVIHATQLSNTSAHNALAFLVAVRSLETSPDGSRHPRYLRYRLTERVGT